MDHSICMKSVLYVLCVGMCVCARARAREYAYAYVQVKAYEYVCVGTTVPTCSLTNLDRRHFEHKCPP